MLKVTVKELICFTLSQLFGYSLHLYSDSQTQTKIISFISSSNGKWEQIDFLSESFIRASCKRLRSFVHHGESAYCSTWMFWIKNWKDLDVRYQPIQVPLSFFISFFLSFFLFFIVNFFSDRKPRICMFYKKLIYMKKHTFPYYVINEQIENKRIHYNIN